MKPRIEHRMVVELSTVDAEGQGIETDPDEIAATTECLLDGLIEGGIKFANVEVSPDELHSLRRAEGHER